MDPTIIDIIFRSEPPTRQMTTAYAYEYSIESATPQGECAVGELREEIIAAGLTNVGMISTAGDWLGVCFSAALSGPQEAMLTSVLASHVPLPPPPAAGPWQAVTKTTSGSFSQITAGSESGSHHTIGDRVFVICTYLVRASAAVGQGVVHLEVPWRAGPFVTGGCACGIAVSAHDGIQPTSVESTPGTKEVQVAHTLVGCAVGVDLRVSLTFTYKL